MRNWYCISILLVALFCACKEEKPQSAPILIDDPSVEIIDSLHSSSLDSTGLSFELTSPRATTRLGKQNFITEYPKGLDIKFFNASGGYSSISANYAYVDENSIATLKGDVKIVSEQGDQLETSFLNWDQRYRMVQTDKLVRLIQTKGDTSYGFGLLASQDFSRFKIEKGYAGKVKFEDLKQKLGVD